MSQTTLCKLCGTWVEVVSSNEGTTFYQPFQNELVNLRKYVSEYADRNFEQEGDTSGYALAITLMEMIDNGDFR